MPLRVRLVPGIPAGFLAEADHAVDDRGDLPVTGAKIEADAAAIEVTAELQRRGGLAWELRMRRGQEFERCAVCLLYTSPSPRD